MMKLLKDLDDLDSVLNQSAPAVAARLQPV